MKKSLLLVLILFSCLLFPLRGDTGLDRAAKNFILGNFTEADKNLKEYLAAHPDDKKAIQLQAELYREMEDIGVTLPDDQVERPEPVEAVPEKPSVSVSEPVSVPVTTGSVPDKFTLLPSEGLAPRVNGQRVLFRIKVRNAKSVSVAGDFNQWDKTSHPLVQRTETYWSGQFELSPGEHEYKYVIDDEFISDPNNRSSRVIVKPEVKEPTPQREQAEIVTATPEQRPAPERRPPAAMTVPSPPTEVSVSQPVERNIFNTSDWEGIQDLSLSPKLLPDGSVQFTLYAPHAREVLLVGDFNNWDPTRNLLKKTESGIWVTHVPISMGSYAYNFIVDGNWVQDPDNPLFILDKYGNRNSLFNLEKGDRGTTNLSRPTNLTLDREPGKSSHSSTVPDNRVKSTPERIMQLYNRLKKIQARVAKLKETGITVPRDIPGGIERNETFRSGTDRTENLLDRSKKLEERLAQIEKYSKVDMEQSSPSLSEENPVATDVGKSESERRSRIEVVRNAGHPLSEPAPVQPDRTPSQVVIRVPKNTFSDPSLKHGISPLPAKITGVTLVPFEQFGFSKESSWIGQRIEDVIRKGITEKPGLVILDNNAWPIQGISGIDQVPGDVVLVGSVLFRDGSVFITMGMVDRRDGDERFHTFEFQDEIENLDRVTRSLVTSLLSSL